METTTSSAPRARLLTLLVLFDLISIAHADHGDSEKVAHAAIGSTAWVFIFPLGAVVMRLAKGPKAWLLHASLQSLGLAMVVGGTANAIYLARVTDQVDNHHPIIGLVIFSLAFFQAAGRYMAHVLFVEHQRRSLVGHAHTWAGRAIVTLGMINGGLGLLLSDHAMTGEYIAYGVIAAVVWIVLVGNGALFEIRRFKTGRNPIAKEEELEWTHSSFEANLRPDNDWWRKD